MADYHIEFFTKEMPGRLVSIKVSLGKEVHRDMNKPLAINLCDDPLYPALERYVLNNRKPEPA